MALGGLKSEKNYVIGGLKTKILLAHLSKCLCLKKSNSIKLTLSNSTNTIFFFLLLVCSQGKRVKWLAHPETFLKCERDWDLQYHYPKPLLSKSCKLISITWWNESKGKYPTSKYPFDEYRDWWEKMSLRSLDTWIMDCAIPWLCLALVCLELTVGQKI